MAGLRLRPDLRPAPRLRGRRPLLQETLDEEGEADKKLTELAETVINVEAEESNSEAEEAAASRR